MNLKLVVIGGVAGGATAAARARRQSEEAEITLVERGPYVSFANCGLPYYLSGDITKRSSLLLQTPEGFHGRYGVKVLLNTQALEIDRTQRKVRVAGPEGERWLDYDRLILAQGSNPIVPTLPGADAPHCFTIWSVPDMDRIHSFLKDHRPVSAVIVGGGFIGLEMAEAFLQRGLAVTLVELAPQVLGTLDSEFGNLVRAHLEGRGIHVMTGVGLKAVASDARTVELSDGRHVPADLVLFSVGVRSELALARHSGLALGATGGLLVNEELQTSDPLIWAAGDMVELVQRVTGGKARIPLAGPANRQGRIAATNALGGHQRYPGALGTSVVKVLDVTVASTGLTEKAARAAGLDVGVAMIHKEHHAGYYPGGRVLTLKLVYERPTGRLLGGQAFGGAGVDKRIDVLATALAGHMSLADLADLDLAYSPPYSSANDPINVAAFVGLNDLDGSGPLLTPAQVAERLSQDPVLVLDVRNLGSFLRGHLPGAVNIPVDELRGRLAELSPETAVIVYCDDGFRGHLAVRILRQNGFQELFNVTGGYINLRASGLFQEEL